MKQKQQSAHTPGPWTWGDGYTLRPTNPDPDKHAVHTILEVENFAYGFVCAALPDVLAESEANQALIAAAPELLSLLKEAERLVRGMGCEIMPGSAVDSWLADIAAAIDKAEGRP